MTKLISILLSSVLILCGGCTVVSANRVFPKFAWYWSADAKMQREENAAHRASIKQYESEMTTLALKIQKRDGTNFIGVYQGMIAEHDGKGSVMMFSVSSGEALKYIPYQDFRDIFVLKTRAEYGVPGLAVTNRLEIPKAQ